MNAPLSEFAKVSVRCPRCGRSSEFKVGRVRHNPNVKCPTCWAPFAVDTSRLENGLGAPRQEHCLSLVDNAHARRR
jgi:hypothetical protein